MTYKKRFILVLASLVLATPVSAATIPVFDVVVAYNSTGVDHNTVKTVEISPEDGSIFFGTVFSGLSVDLDPSSGTDSFSSAGNRDAFLTKFASDGSYEWSKTWGGSGNDYNQVLDFLTDGTLLAAGTFVSTVDFDPGAGTAYATSSGSDDVYVSFFNTDGVLESVITFGGTGVETFSNLLSTDAGFYLTGSFNGTVDFDPGAGTAYATSSGSYDVFLSKFTNDGVFEWVKTWGGSSFDFPSSEGLAVDADGNVFVTIFFFADTVDFDPGAGTAYATSSGSYDTAVSKFSSGGDFEWFGAWGGTGVDIAAGLAAGSDGSVYVLTGFNGTVDFDPSAGTAYATSTGSADIAFSKLSSDGVFQWVKSWGGTGSDDPYSLQVDSDGTVYATGRFLGTIDFDPGVGTAPVASQGAADMFVSRFTAGGDYIDTYTVGSVAGDEWPDRTRIAGVAGSEKLFFAGTYQGTPTDFDPSAAMQNFTSDGNDAYLLVFDLIESEVTVSDTSGEASEAGTTFSYDVVLTTPPTDDVVITVTPDSQLSVSTTSLTFASTTWNVPQTVIVTAVDDEEVENETHTGTITHTAASDDASYDGVAVGGVTVSITEDDSASSASYSPRAIRAVTAVEPVVPLQATPLTPEQVQEAIEAVKQQLITVIKQLIVLLQEEIARLSAQ